MANNKCLETGKDFMHGNFLVTVNSKLGNQLVSYTRQMDLVRIREQAKFENASLRTKHFGI